MKNYDILFQGYPDAKEVHDILAADDHRFPTNNNYMTTNRVVQGDTVTTV